MSHIGFPFPRGIVAIAAAVAFSGAVPGSVLAQDPGFGQGSFYLDERTPVDPDTRSRVDAYFDQLEDERRARAEEQERFERFIHHDNVVGPQQSGRF